MSAQAIAVILCCISQIIVILCVLRPRAKSPTWVLKNADITRVSITRDIGRPASGSIEFESSDRDRVISERMRGI